MALPGRTTAALVAKIIEVDVEGVDLDAFIDPANEMVTEVCGAVATGYSPSRLELIERWLSAHFFTVLSPRPVRERVSTLVTEYMHKVDLGLDTSHYGQMAMRLDTKGGLALLNNSMKTQKGILSGGTTTGGALTPGVKWLGTIPEE